VKCGRLGFASGCSAPDLEAADMETWGRQAHHSALRAGCEHYRRRDKQPGGIFSEAADKEKKKLVPLCVRARAKPPAERVRTVPSPNPPSAHRSENESVEGEIHRLGCSFYLLLRTRNT
jgi:hypothetical protein